MRSTDSLERGMTIGKTKRESLFETLTKVLGGTPGPASYSFQTPNTSRKNSLGLASKFASTSLLSPGPGNYNSHTVKAMSPRNMCGF